MYSSYQRINNLTSFLTTCLFALGAVIAATTFILRPLDKRLIAGSVLSVKLDKIAPRRVGYHGQRQDVAELKFNLTSDLSTLFHWNTKQIFVYLTADYISDAKEIQHNVVVWDKIIQSADKAKLNVVNARPKYPLRDYTKTFQNARPATYTLHYDVMPWVGVLTSGEAALSTGETSFEEVIKAQQEANRKKAKQ